MTRKHHKWWCFYRKRVLSQLSTCFLNSPWQQKEWTRTHTHTLKGLYLSISSLWTGPRGINPGATCEHILSSRSAPLFGTWQQFISPHYFVPRHRVCFSFNIPLWESSYATCTVDMFEDLGIFFYVHVSHMHTCGDARTYVRGRCCSRGVGDRDVACVVYKNINACIQIINVWGWWR